MSILLSLLLTSLFHIQTYSRTCVCAYFEPAACDAQVHCVWNPTGEATVGATKGNHGICRSQPWFDCHVNPECVHYGNNPELELAFEEQVNLKMHVANGDWPYCCKSEEPNSTPYCPDEFGVPEEDELDNVLAGHVNIKNSKNLSINMIGKLIALITVVVLISIGVCYKFAHKNEKQLQSLKSNFETYNSI